MERAPVAVAAELPHPVAEDLKVGHAASIASPLASRGLQPGGCAVQRHPTVGPPTGFAAGPGVFSLPGRTIISGRNQASLTDQEAASAEFTDLFRAGESGNE